MLALIAGAVRFATSETWTPLLRRAAVAPVRTDATTPQAAAIEARNIPTGTVVQLTLTPETGTAVPVQSTPLAGTMDLSTATASVTIPHGFWRFFAPATWTPPPSQ